MNQLIGLSLAGCDVAPDGSGVSLKLCTANGSIASILLPADCLHQLLMTLPRAISMALQARYKTASHRLVFPLTDWRLETMPQGDGLILTLSAQPGFEVAFAVSRDDLAGMFVTADQANETALPEPGLVN